MSLLNYKSNNNEIPTEEKEEDENLWYARSVVFFFSFLFVYTHLQFQIRSSKMYGFPLKFKRIV